MHRKVDGVRRVEAHTPALIGKARTDTTSGVPDHILVKFVVRSRRHDLRVLPISLSTSTETIAMLSAHDYAKESERVRRMRLARLGTRPDVLALHGAPELHRVPADARRLRGPATVRAPAEIGRA